MKVDNELCGETLPIGFGRGHGGCGERLRIRSGATRPPSYARQKFTQETRLLEPLLDDRLSAGSLGLIRAVESFDPRREVKFSSYACKCIRGTICNNQVHGRSARSVAKCNALVQCVEEPPESEYTPPPPQLDRDEARKAFLDRLQTLLPPKQYDMFLLYYYHNQPTQEIAKRYQCSGENVRRHRKIVHDTIKDYPELVELLESEPRHKH